MSAKESTRSVRIERHRHGGGEFAFTPKGESLLGVACGNGLWVEQSAGGRSHQSLLRKGIVQVMPEGEPRVFRHSGDAHHIQVHLSRAFLQKVAEAAERPSELATTFAAEDETLCRLATALLEDAESGGRDGRLYTDSLTTALAARVLARFGAGNDNGGAAATDGVRERSARLSRGMLRRVTDFMHEHLGEDMSVEQLAAVVGLSPGHFSTLFRRAAGVSPYRFLIKQRLERARTLLAEGRGSIAEIATEVGFFDQSHLTRQMRRVLGVSPGRLRRGA